MNVFVKAFLMPKVKMSAKKHFKGSPENGVCSQSPW